MSAANNTKELAGVLAFFDEPDALVAAMQKVNDSKKFKRFDAFTPFPVHGLDKAQGLRRSWIPYITFTFGMSGTACAFLLQYWTSTISWPLIVGGKPFNSWPAFVPVIFELTILFAGLSTFFGMLLINGLPNFRTRAFDPALTRDRFSILIEAPRKGFSFFHWAEGQEPKLNAFDEKTAADFLREAGGKEIRTVYHEGWF
jgi:hypothetical protein